MCSMPIWARCFRNLDGTPRGFVVKISWALVVLFYGFFVVGSAFLLSQAPPSPLAVGAIVFSSFNLFITLALWVFVLAKQFSTHRVVFNPQQAIQNKPSRLNYHNDGTMTEDEKAAKFGRDVTDEILKKKTKMVNPTKEKNLVDSLF